MLMVKNIKENGLIIKSMAWVNVNILMEIIMKDNGKIIKDKEMVS